MQTEMLAKHHGRTLCTLRPLYLPTHRHTLTSSPHMPHPRNDRLLLAQTHTSAGKHPPPSPHLHFWLFSIIISTSFLLCLAYVHGSVRSCPYHMYWLARRERGTKVCASSILTYALRIRVHRTGPNLCI